MLGRLCGRVRGRRGEHGAARCPANGRGRARRNAYARRVRLRALFVLRAGHFGPAAAGRAMADHVHARGARDRDQRVRRPRGRRRARVHRPAHGRPRLRLTAGRPDSPWSTSGRHPPPNTIMAAIQRILS